MARHLVLDIRGLEPPEPLERVLSAIADFGRGDTLRILSDFEPKPLYRILERDGLRVVDAADGPAALAIIEATEVDAVLTDHHMAGMSGIELYTAALAAQPALAHRFVVMSGEPGADDLVRFADETGVTIVAKPFDVQVVSATVRELVRDGAAT